jgi:hypothetical protein
MMPSWNADVYFNNQTSNGFTAVFSSPAPTGASVDFLIVPISVAGAGVVYPTIGVNSFQIGVQSAFNALPLVVLPSWNSNVWISARTSSLATASFSNPSPPSGQLSYLFPSASEGGSVSITTGAIQQTVSLPGLVLPFQVIATPSWNTTVDAIKSNSSVSFNFSNPAPVGAFLNYAYNQS